MPHVPHVPRSPHGRHGPSPAYRIGAASLIPTPFPLRSLTVNTTTRPEYILTLACPDRAGIVHTITGLLLASDGFRSEETAAAERALEEAAYSLSLGDAKGNEHRVTDVEYSPEKQTKKGGSTRTVTLVMH